MAALIGGGLALLLLIGLSLWFFVFSGEDSHQPEGQDSELTAQVESGDDEASAERKAKIKTVEMAIPSSSPAYVEVKLARVWKSWLFRAFEADVIAQLEGNAEYATFHDRTGLTIADFKQMEIGAEIGPRGPVPIILTKLKRLKPEPFEAWLIERSGGDTAEAAGVTLRMDARSGTGVGLIGSKRIALGTPSGLQAAASRSSWKKNETMSATMAHLDSNASVRAILTLTEEIKGALPLDEMPSSQPVKVDDVIGASIDIEDSLVLEVVYSPSGDDAEARLEATHQELKELLKVAKKQKKAFAEEMKGAVPEPVIEAGLAALKSLKLKKRDGTLYARIKLGRGHLEPLVALAKGMAPPAPPKAKPEPKASPTTEDQAGAAVSLPETCKRLVTCCDALAEEHPATRAACQAQKDAFEKLAELPAQARAKMEKSCEDSLRAYTDLPNAPSACSTD